MARTSKIETALRDELQTAREDIDELTRKISDSTRMLDDLTGRETTLLNVLARADKGPDLPESQSE